MKLIRLYLERTNPLNST